MNTANMLPAKALASPAAEQQPPRRPEGKLCVQVLESPEQLSRYHSAWADLAGQALEPNVCYEPWLVLPALQFLSVAAPRFVLVFAAERGPDSPSPLLHGFFPVVARRGYRGLPVRYLTMWQHDQSILAVPLLRTGQAGPALAAFLDWARGERTALVELPQAPGQGPFQELLVDQYRQQGRLFFLDEVWSRALFRPRADEESYLNAALSGNHRRDLRRQERRLAEQGRLEFRILEKSDDLSAWIEGFLDLEASGWKGREGTALACSEGSRSFFRALVQSAFALGRLQMLGLFLDDRPIAMKCNLLAGSIGFAYKIAFDESCARYSPGMQLEIGLVRLLHQSPRLEWLDSCAVADQDMYNRLWLDRRIMQTVLLSTGRCPGDLVVSLLPLLRWLKRCFRRRR
jgi:hypothetical protein